MSQSQSLPGDHFQFIKDNGYLIIPGLLETERVVEWRRQDEGKAIGNSS